jgi:hypothetical protein
MCNQSGCARCVAAKRLTIMCVSLRSIMCFCQACKLVMKLALPAESLARWAFSPGAAQLVPVPGHREAAETSEFTPVSLSVKHHVGHYHHDERDSCGIYTYIIHMHTR